MSSVAVLQEKQEQDASFKLELTRVIAAPRERVFDAWTRPDVIRQWFGPGTIVTPSLDPRESGSYALTMEGALDASEAKTPGQRKGMTNTVTGVYTKVSPYDLLQFTWSATWCPGETSLVTLHFRELDGGTELKLVQERFLTEQSRDGHLQGWQGGLDQLARVLEK